MLKSSWGDAASTVIAKRRSQCAAGVAAADLPGRPQPTVTN